MQNILKRFVVLALGALLSSAVAGGAAPQPLRLGQQTYTYACAGGQSVQVSYVTTGAQHSGNPTFVVLRYRGQSYGLAQAVSGSGVRYVGLAGLTVGSGLEWWEHQGEGTLSTFRGDQASEAQPLLSCRLRV